MNARQRRILAYAHQHGLTFTNQAYQKANGVDRDLAYREIQELIRLNTVARPAERYGRTYVVVERAAASSLPADLASILDILSAQGYVTNADLRKAWGMSRSTVWRQVTELVGRGFLYRKGTKRGVRYYPTARLQGILSEM